MAQQAKQGMMSKKAPVIKAGAKKERTLVDNVAAALPADKAKKDEDYYHKIHVIGIGVLKEFFNNADDIDKTSNPWVKGLKSKKLPKYNAEYNKFVEELAKKSTKVDAHRPLIWQGVKMASQDNWLKSVGLDDAANNLPASVKHALISYKNDDMKMMLVARFLSSEVNKKTAANLTALAKKIYSKPDTTAQEPKVILETSHILEAGELNTLYNDAQKWSKELVDASKQYDKATRQVNDTLREVQMVYSELISKIKTAIKLAGSTPKLKPQRKKRKKAE